MSKKILIIDDTDHIRILVKGFLGPLGYEILEASNGVQGLNVLAMHEDINLILLDYMMPELNGLEVLEKLRSLERRDLMVCMLTAKGLREDIVQCLKSGAHDYIVKPLDGILLVEKVKQLLGEGGSGFASVKTEIEARILLSESFLKTKVIKLSEEALDLQCESELPVGSKMILNCPFLERQTQKIEPFLVRVLRTEREGREYRSHVTFIGLNENESRGLRSLAQRGEEINEA